MELIHNIIRIQIIRASDFNEIIYIKNIDLSSYFITMRVGAA